MLRPTSSPPRRTVASPPSPPSAIATVMLRRSVLPAGGSARPMSGATRESCAAGPTSVTTSPRSTTVRRPERDLLPSPQDLPDEDAPADAPPARRFPRCPRASARPAPSRRPPRPPCRSGCPAARDRRPRCRPADSRARRASPGVPRARGRGPREATVSGRRIHDALRRPEPLGEDARRGERSLDLRHRPPVEPGGNGVGAHHDALIGGDADVSAARPPSPPRASGTRRPGPRASARAPRW